MRNLSDLLRLAAARWPDAEAVTFRHRRHTYGQLAELVGGRARQLQDEGIRRGDAVVSIAANSDVLLIDYLALATLGAVHGPLNTMSTAEDIAEVMQRLDASLVICGSDFAPLAERVLHFPGRRLRCVPLANETDGELDQIPRSELRASSARGDDPALVIFTSGSTGRPKGCVKSHSNLLWHVVNHQLAMPRTSADRELYTIPLASIGLANFALLGFTVGAALVLDRFDASSFLATISKEGITTAFVPPTMLHAVLAHRGGGATETGSLRALYTGYEMSGRLRQRIADRFGPIVHYGYGSSEGTFSYASADRFLSDPQCVGRVFGLDELMVVDPNGGELPLGEVGEIVARGPSVFREYLGDAELTASVLRDGWYHTGDLGWMGAGRMLHFAGRLKDMIKTGGMNVAAAEVEQALASHEDIEAIAVVGVPDERWGEAVAAAVVVRGGSTGDAADLEGYARGQLAAYKRPKHYVFLNQLPLNPAGKVAKETLRQRVIDELARSTASEEKSEVPARDRTD